MKKLINDPQDVVAEALLGIEAARPEVRVDHANRIIYRRDAPKAGKVGLVSGGVLVTSRCMAGSSGSACLMRPAREIFTHQRLIRCSRRPRVSMLALACCTL